MYIQIENLAIALPIAILQDCINSYGIAQTQRIPQNTVTKRQLLRLVKQSKQYLTNLQSELLNMRLCEIKALRKGLYLDKNKAFFDTLNTKLYNMPLPKKQSQIRILDEIKSLCTLLLETITDIINLSDIKRKGYKYLDETPVFQTFELKILQRICFDENGKRRKGTINQDLNTLFDEIDKSENPVQIW